MLVNQNWEPDFILRNMGTYWKMLNKEVIGCGLCFKGIVVISVKKLAGQR